MSEPLCWAAFAAAVVNTILLIALLIRFRATSDNRDIGRLLQEDLRSGRDEAARASRELREELAHGQRNSIQDARSVLGQIADLQNTRLEQVSKDIQSWAESNQTVLDRLGSTVHTGIRELQGDNQKKLEEIRQTMEDKLGTLEKIRETFETKAQAMIEGNEKKLEETRVTVDERLKTLEAIKSTIGDGLKEIQTENEKRLDGIRQVVDDRLAMLEKIRDTLDERIRTLQDSNQQKLDEMRKVVDEKLQGTLGEFRSLLEGRIKELQEGNEKKLEEMRQTVDEKLQKTLESRVGESFKIVGDQLEAVHKGLGEMKSLALDVGGLKKVLSNVKTRGNFGEVQLGAILESILAPGQYEKNVKTKEDSDKNVEYAIRLPGGMNDPLSPVWLPIDAKFLDEDYSRIQAAAEKGDAEALDAAVEALIRAVHLNARIINEKYLDPPATTDFAIMFLATEGLYAEVVRHPSLIDQLQQRHRVVVAGPTTLAALLCSLRMGFQTVAIGERATEVWKVLSAVKTEFGKFGIVLDKLRKNLNTAQKTLDDTGVRTRAMQRKLRRVEQLPEELAGRVLELPEGHIGLVDDEDVRQAQDLLANSD